MSKKTGITGIIVSLLALVTACVLVSRISGIGGDSSSDSGKEGAELIDESVFKILGASTTFADVSNCRLKFGARFSEAEYESLKKRSPESEVGLIVIAERDCPETLTKETSGAVVKAYELSELTANDGYYEFATDIFKVSSPETVLCCVGYITEGERTEYTAVCRRSVEYIAERAYEDPEYTDKTKVIPFLSESYKQANGISGPTEAGG